MKTKNWRGNVLRISDLRNRPGTGRSKSRRRAVELLEARTMLAGDFTNAPISDAELAAILAGLDAFAEFGRGLSETGQFAEPLALLEGDPDQPIVVGTVGISEDITIGSVLDIGDVLDEKLAGPVRAYLDALAPANRNTDGLVAFLGSLPEVTSIMGGLATMPADELRFEMTFQFEVQSSDQGIDLGAQGDALGIMIEERPDVPLTVAMNMQFAFGVDRNAELNAEQAFFLRDTTVGVTADVHVPRGIMEEEGIYHFLVGFLDVDVTDGMIDLDLDLAVTLNNVVPDALGNVTLSELNGYAASELAEIDVTANSVAATFDVTATVGSWTAAGTPQIMVGGSAIGGDPAVSTNADFAELLNFNNVDAERLLDGLNLFGSWLDGFADSSVLDVDVPFAAGATLGNTIVRSDVYFAMVDQLRDAAEQPIFHSVQQLATVLGVNIDYDPMASQIEYPNLNFIFAPLQKMSPLALGDSSQADAARCVGPVCGLETAALATLTTASVVELDFNVDLSSPGQLIEDQFSLDGVVVRGGVTENAMNVAGSARYGLVGIDFSGGTYSGTSSFRADIVDPINRDSLATLGELLAGLGDPATLLGPPLALVGATTLELANVSIQDALFAIPAGAVLTAQVADLAQPTVTSLVETGIGVLGNFANLTQDFLVNSVAGGLAEAAKWELSGGLDAFVSVGLELADFIDTQAIDAAVDAVQRAFDTFEESTDTVARLQDVDEILTDYLADLVTDAIGSAANFVATLSVDAPAATLDIGLTLVASASEETLPLGLDISALADATGEVTIQGIGDFSGTFDPIDATVSLSLDLDFQVDLSVVAAPEAYLLTTSALVASVYVEVPGGGPTITAEGSIGILGLTLDTCSFVIAADRTMPDPAAPATLTVGLDDSAPGGRVPIDELSLATLDTSATGEMDFNCRVTVAPSVTPETSRFHFRIGNLNNPIGSLAFPISPPDFPTLIAGINLDTTLNGFPLAIDDLFGDLELALNLQVLGLKFPLIGGNLGGVANVLGLLRTKFNLHLGSLGTFDTSSIELALEAAIFDLFGTLGDRVDVAIPSVDEVLFTIAFSGAPINESEMFSTDLGLPALGASFDAEMSVVGRYHMAFTIGVSRTDGIYLDTTREHEVEMTLDINTTGAFTGRLGFIQVDVTAGPGGTCMTSGAMPVPTAVHAEFDIGLTDPDADGKLKVSELGHGNLIDMPNTGLDGCADIDIVAEASVVDWLPSIFAGISIDWDFDGTDLAGSVPRVTYEGVGLRLGTFLSGSLGKILEGVDSFFDGICPAIEVAAAPLPLIGEALPDPDSAIEIAAEIFPFLKPLAFLVEVGNSICAVTSALEATSDTINFGDLRFGIDDDNNPATDPLFDARQPGLSFNLNQQVTLDPDTPPWQQFLNKLPQLEAEVQSIESSDGELSFPFIQNPLGVFEYLLGFGELEIFAYRFPTLEATIPFHVSVPLSPIPFLNAIILGDLTMRFNVTIGYDTKGFEEFLESGNVGDLFHGFYVSDTAEPDGSGPDISEFEVSGSLVAGPSIGVADVLEVYVAGGLEASLGVDLIDQNGDGKIHGDEFVSQEGCLQLLGEIGLRLEAGAVVAGLPYRYPFAHATLGEFNEIIHCTLPGITTPPETQENLATLSGGQLTLLMGPRAGERSIKQGETDEGFTVIRLDGDCDGMPGGTIVVKAFGGREEFCNRDVDSIYADGGDGDDRVTIDSRIHKPATLLGGTGDDVLIGGSASDSIDGEQGHDFIDGGDEADEIDGGNGNDVIDGGPGGDTINGGNGDDSIAGEDDPDVINGGDGNDTIEGGDENSPGDTIDGEAGDDIIYGGFGDDVITTGDGDNIAYGDPGMDTITGGADFDAIYGGDDDDSILGMAGEDVLLGDDGDDDIFGGDDPDLIDGRAGDDEIEGELGDDELFGGSDEDKIEGGNGADLIEGGADNDTITGGDDDDMIRGGEGSDEIDGGLGADQIFGDGGNDTIHGNEGSAADDDGSCDPVAEFDPDTIFGGDNDDDITGDCDNDLIFGEAGRDDIHGNNGFDTIDGGDGNDPMIAGDADADDLTGGDGNDVIDGGTENDTARGGPGNDQVFGQAGFDLLYGDGDDDTIEGGTQADTIDGGANDDHLIGNGDTDQIFGNTGGDVIEGNDGGDVLFGNRGEDLMYGDGGRDDLRGGPENDTIRGGDDNDTAHGGSGDDLILGHRGNDELFGDLGSDVIYGHLGNDTATGGTGNDRAFGELGDDMLIGEDGDDILEGGPGNDTASGGAGRDALYGDEGVDNLSGGDNDDFIMAGDGIGDVLNGDAGNDHIVGSDDGAEDPNFGDTNFFGDVIDGGPGVDTIESLGGADVITVGSGTSQPLTQGLLGYWPFDGDGADESGAGRDLTLFGGATTAAGLFGDALDLHGNTSQFAGRDPIVDSVFDLTGTSYTIQAWVNFNQTATEQVLIEKLDNNLPPGWTLTKLLSNNIRFHADVLLDSAAPVNVNPGWHHVVVVRDGGTISMRYDGAEVASVANVASTITASSQPLLVGGRTQFDGRPFPLDGRLDDVAIWSRALSEAEIASICDFDVEFQTCRGKSISDSPTVTDLDFVTDGTHTDQILGGPPLPGPTATFDVSTGPDVGGHWGELDGSATDGGLTEVGGFEQATFANDDGVYVAWVDWRNGNSEIYLAFHEQDSGDWIEINGSASGGGVSGRSSVLGDPDQSRRPTVVEIENGLDVMGNPRRELLVAWTRIDSAGNSTIEVAKRDGLMWTRVANPGQAGKPDHAKLVRYSDESALLGWIDAATGTRRVTVAQYIYEPGCFEDFRSGLFGGFMTNSATRPTSDVTAFDIAAVENRAVVAASFGPDSDQDIDVSVVAQDALLQANTLCPPLNFTLDVETAGTWSLLDTFTDGDAVEPTVAMRIEAIRDQGPNEVELKTDLYVAWHGMTDREDQVIGMVRRQEFNGSFGPWEELVPQYRVDAAPRVAAGSISDTIGYAARPELAASNSHVFLGWMDDGVGGGSRGDSSGRSSLFVMSALGASRTVAERLVHDASGIGISPTGGSIDSISISTESAGLDSGSPYVAWTDHNADDPGVTLAANPPQVLLRHDLDVPQFFVLVTQTGGSTRVTEGGATDTYSIVLMSQPSNNVRIDLNPSSQVTVSAPQLIFTTTNWFTPQIVTVRAVDDMKVEGTHTGTIEYSVASFDPDYNAITVFPDVCVIRDNDFGITDFVPQFAGGGKKRTITSFTVTTVGVTDPTQVNSQNLRLSQSTARGAGKPIPLRSITFDPATELATLTPNKPLTLNKNYLLTASNISGVAAAQPFILNVGTSLTLLDRDGDRATLSLGGSPGFGYFKTLGSKNEVPIKTLEFRTTISGTGAGIVLSGTAKRARGSDGIVTPPASQSIGVSAGTTFTSTLTNPPVRIGPLPQATIDELLVASGGTLAGILIA